MNENENQIELELLPDEQPEPVFEGDQPIEIIQNITDYVPRQPNAAFLRSVEQWGIYTPIVLNRISEDEYHLMAGRKRLKAAEILELELIPVKMYEVDSLSESVLTIDSNAQRSDNPLSDMEAILDLSNNNLDEKAIARLTGLTVGTVRKRMKLIDVPTEIIQGVRDGKVAIGTAEDVAKLSTKDKADLVLKLERKSKLIGKDVTEVRRAAQDKASADQIPAAVFETPDFDPDAHVHEYQLKIEHSFAEPVIEARCSCGQMLDKDEIEDLVNRRF